MRPDRDRLDRLEYDMQRVAFQISGMAVRMPKGGSSPATANQRFARVYGGSIDGATGPLAADWETGMVKYQDDTTGVLDSDPTEVTNKWIGQSWAEDAQVLIIDGVIVDGTCAAVDWGD